MQSSSQIVTTNKPTPRGACNRQAACEPIAIGWPAYRVVGQRLADYRHPSILQVGCPSCRPTNSVTAPKGKRIIFHGLADPKPTWSLPSVSLTTQGSRLPLKVKVAKPHCQPSDSSIPMDTEAQNTLSI